MRISTARLILAAILFTLLTACGTQPPTTGAWSDFSNEKAKETKEAPKTE